MARRQVLLDAEMDPLYSKIVNFLNYWLAFDFQY